MEKYKKDSNAMWIILAVMVILAVGFVAYKVGKNSNLAVVTPPVDTGTDGTCKTNSPASITVLSPNGGETYTSTQKIPVTWKSCNIATKNVAIGLKNDTSGSESIQLIAPDNGNTELYPSLAGKYKVVICDTKLDPNAFLEVAYIEDCSASDYSDNSFTINAASVSSTKIYSDKNFGYTFEYPKLLTVSSEAGGGRVNLSIPGSTENPTLVTTSVGSANNGSGKFGAFTISYNNGWVAQQQHDEDGSYYTASIVPMDYTASGLPIFGGSSHHGFGMYAYVVALSHTKFVRIDGPEAYNGGGWDQANDPTWKIVKSVTAL